MSSLKQVDHIVIETCAKVILVSRGFHNTHDMQKLAIRLADTVQDFLAELSEESDNER